MICSINNRKELNEMKTYNAPEFELVVSLDSYCDGTIETENVSSHTAGTGYHQVTLPNDPLGALK